MDTRHARNYLKTLARGIRVLTAFTPVKPELSLTDIAEFLDVDPSTASRFTYTLQQLGYLARDPRTRQYRVTPQVYAFSISLVGPRNLRQVGLPHMERLRDRTGETVVLSVRDGTEIVIVEVVETHHTLAPRGWVGGRAPVHCSAMGKAILAHLSESELARTLDAVRYAPMTPNTITSRLDLLKDLEETRERGWSLNDEEFRVGIVSVGAPIFSGKGRATAAICIDVPSARIDDRAHLEHLAEEVMHVAEEISALRADHGLGMA